MSDGAESDGSDIVFQEADPRPRAPAAVVVLSDGDDSDDDDLRILDPLKEEATQRAAAVVASAGSRPLPVPSTSKLAASSAYPYDYPLPKETKPWDLKRYMPMRYPPPDHLGKGKRAISIELGIEPAPTEPEEESVEEIRIKERLVEGTRWDFEFQQQRSLGPPHGLVRPDAPRQSPKKPRHSHDAAFFPFAHLEELEYMRGVAAIVGGSRIEIIRLSDIDSAASDGQGEQKVKSERVAYAKGNGKATRSEGRGREEQHDFLTVAWSIRLDTWPYLPILAVAGRSRMIYIYHLYSELTAAGDRAFELVLDRSLAGHGQPIWSLSFHPNFPHLLASGSEDRTVCLWDPCVDGGMDDDVLEKVQQRAKKNESNSQTVVRPFVEGELLAKFTEEGHKAGVFVDFHPKLPLIISSGMDACINIWTVPPPLLGPALPSPLDVLPSTCTAPRLSAKQPQLLDDATVFSRAQLEHVDGGMSSSVVKIWIADKLNPERMGDEAANAMRARRNPLEEDLKPQANRPLAFKVRLQVDLTDPTFIGCTLGLHRTPDYLTSLINEPFLVYPTSTPPLALLTFTPQSLRQFGEPPPNASQAERVKFLDEAMWPPNRKRPMYDHFPRMSPAVVTDVEAPLGAVFRTIAVEPQGGRFLLGVGDDGLQAVWRVQRREVKEEEELAEETEKLSVT